MKKLFEEFTIPNLEAWKALLAKELKTEAEIDPTAFTEEVEELTIQKIYDSPSEITYTTKKTTNDWQIGVYINVENEEKANQVALKLLNTGANALNFRLSDERNLNLDTLLKNIEVAFIHCFFTVKTDEQASHIQNWFAAKSPLFLHSNQQNNYVNAYPISSIGGNATQELAFALSEGKNRIANNPQASIHFNFGIGNNFLVEIAKFRAFGILWDKIKTVYQSTSNTYITATTGFVNKSLADPYTNLLRQTTEALSAVLGGVDQLVVQPYDALSTEGSSEFAERMAINNALILKEESEINQLIDPFGGSIVIEKITETLCDAAWKLFQQLEEKDETARLNFLKVEVERIRSKRIELVNSKKHTLVGINKFSNPDTSTLKWKKEIEGYFGMEKLILENEY